MIRYVKVDPARTARGLVADVYSQMKQEFGVLGEPMTLHSAVPDLLAGVWSSFRETLLAGIVPRQMKEAVAVAVSQLNRCPYCIDAHTVILRATSSHEAASAVRDHREGRIGDPAMQALVRWARVTGTPGASELASPPFSREQSPEIIGTAVWIHYINRMVKVFIGKNLIPLSSNRLGLRSLAERMGGMLFFSAVRKRLAPGESLRLLKSALPAEDLEWAAPSPSVARSFASFVVAADEAGRVALSSEVRSAVSGYLSGWNGGKPGLDQDWLAAFLSGLPPRGRPGGKLALLAAIAPDRIDESCIRAFRKEDPSDRVLLGAVAWSSLAAARRISSWIRG